MDITYDLPTNSDPRQTTYGYDAKGNPTTISAPLGVGSKTLTYDALSRVKTVKDNKGQTTTVDYDALDRVTKLTFAGGATVVNTYDDDGNLTKQDTNGGGLLEATVTTTYAYDKLNRQIAKTEAGVSFTSTYDGVGNLKSLTDPSGTTSYIYNSVNLLTELSEPGGAKTTFGYDDAYRRTRTTYPNGVVQNATYDSSGKVTSVIGKKADGTVLTSFTYDYVNPANGKDTTLLYKMTDAAGSVTTYGYDGLDRLSEANGPTGHFEYTYDGNGNRLTQKIDGQLTSYTSNEADQLTTAGSTTYSYDANGNRTGQSGGATLSYNSRDQMIGYQPPALGSALVDMKYLGAGQGERIKAGSASFTNGPRGLASTKTSATLSSTTANYTRDNDGTLVSQRIGQSTYYYLFDRLGSVVALTDAAGNEVNTYIYDPYGNHLSGTTEAVANPWQFAGGYKDSFSGYYKFGTRYYDPTIGRWTQPDPSGMEANSYAYAAGNPVNFVDPTGLFWNTVKEKFKEGDWGRAGAVAWKAAGVGLAAAAVAGSGGTALVALGSAYAVVNTGYECTKGKMRCALAMGSAALGGSGAFVARSVRASQLAPEINALKTGAVTASGVGAAVTGSYACASDLDKC